MEIKIDFNFIKEERAKNKSWKIIAEEMGIKYSTLSRIVAGNTKLFPNHSEDERYCRICKKMDKIENFYKVNDRGCIYYRHKTCFNSYLKKRYQEKKRKTNGN